MCVIERKTQSFIPRFREIFLLLETVLTDYGVKSDKKHFFSVKFIQFLRKYGTFFD